MATVRPFRAVRPAQKYADKVVSLPYDVMNRQEAEKMAEGNPYSFLHICRSEIDLPNQKDPYDRSVYEKAKQMQEEAEKNLSLERILNFTKTFLVPQPITGEELRQEYWKLVTTKCGKKLEAVKDSITAFVNVLDRLTVKYPDETEMIGHVKESVEKELKRMADVLIKECEKWSADA